MYGQVNLIPKVSISLGKFYLWINRDLLMSVTMHWWSCLSLFSNIEIRNWFQYLNCDVTDVRITTTCHHSATKCTTPMTSVVPLLNVTSTTMPPPRYHPPLLPLPLPLSHPSPPSNPWVSPPHRNHFENIILSMATSIVRKYWKPVTFGHVFNLAVLMVNGFH